MKRYLQLMLPAVLALAGCGSSDNDDPETKAFQLEVKDAGQGAAGGGGEATGFSPDNGASLTAFSETLWPVLKERCSRCHGSTTSPFFALDDKYQAHKTVISSHLVSPTAQPSSRFVTRLALNNHNCWTECPKDADVMLAAIKGWLDKAGIKSGGDNLTRIGPVAISAAKDIVLPGGGGNWVREVETFDSLGAAFDVVEDATASAKKALRRKDDRMITGEVSYVFPIPEGSGYSVWFRVRDRGVGRGLRFRINGGAEQGANLNDNSGDWFWMEALKDQTLKPLIGSNNVTLAISDAQVDVDMVAFTSNKTFDRGLIENTGKRKALEFDLTPTLGKKVFLQLHLAPGPDGASYVLSHPTLRFEEPAKVKIEKLYVLNNAEFNPQYSTFASLSLVVDKTQELSPRGIVVTKKTDADAITLGIGTLAIEP